MYEINFENISTWDSTLFFKRLLDAPYELSFTIDTNQSDDIISWCQVLEAMVMEHCTSPCEYNTFAKKCFDAFFISTVCREPRYLEYIKANAGLISRRIDYDFPSACDPDFQLDSIEKRYNKYVLDRITIPIVAVAVTALV